MSNLPNKIIRVTPPALRGGYCPDSFNELANTIVGGSSAQHDLELGTTFYNFGNQPVYPTPEPPPEPPPPPCPSPEVEEPDEPIYVTWEPSNIELERMAGVQLFNSNINGYISPPDLQDVVFEHTEVNAPLVIENPDVTGIGFPNLTSISNLVIRYCYDLTSLDLCNLITAKGNRSIGDTPIQYDSGLFIAYNYNLTTINLPKFVPTNKAAYLLQDNDLTQQTVENFLLRLVLEPSYVQGVIDLRFNNGYSATALTYRNQLIARGVTFF